MGALKYFISVILLLAGYAGYHFGSYLPSHKYELFYEINDSGYTERQSKGGFFDLESCARYKKKGNLYDSVGSNYVCKRIPRIRN